LHKFDGRGVRNFTFDQASADAVCNKYWKTTTRPEWTPLQWGGYGIADGVIFFCLLVMLQLSSLSVLFFVNFTPITSDVESIQPHIL
jgi:hypothetical protein